MNKSPNYTYFRRLWIKELVRICNHPELSPNVLDSNIKSIFVRCLSTKTAINNNEVTITDPYILYQSYRRNGVIEHDENQVRVMKEFQKLYYRLLDYVPPEELLIRIRLILKKIKMKEMQSLSKGDNGVLSRFKERAIRSISNRSSENMKRQLTKVISDEEELRNLNIPKGLLVHGEVGSGKSMLMDIFASSLPHKSKQRWHYNNFILWVYGEIHRVQKERLLSYRVFGKDFLRKIMEDEFILFEVAHKMIQNNTVLILDEFMLPDIASANIVKTLFSIFFKLGGVLIATSNKLPEELYSNKFNQSQFLDFVVILNNRCLSIDMLSSKDYRANVISHSKLRPNLVTKYMNEEHNEKEWRRLVKTQALGLSENCDEVTDNRPLESLGGQPSCFTVYKRRVDIPLTFNFGSVCYLDFSYICQGCYAASDYISLAARYKVVILDNIPVITIRMKNEAKRFIILLDALYESNCQLFMRSQVDVDYLFFPDTYKVQPKFLEELEITSDKTGNDNIKDAEVYAKTFIDTTTPYRPNVASYEKGYSSTFKEYTNTASKTPLINFNDLSAFTGEDERFAYKRAVLRIKEMTASDNWRAQKKWLPTHKDLRHWEASEDFFDSDIAVSNYSKAEQSDLNKLNFLRKSRNPETKELLQSKLPKDLSTAYRVPFERFNTFVSPVFSSLSHFWALSQWTPKQGKKLRDNIAKSWIRSGSKSDE